MITTQCNLHCKLCNIWREQKKDLDIQKLYKVILAILKRDLKISCLGVTGGEPFLKEDEIFFIFEKIKPYLKQDKICHFNITTNGSFPSRVLNFLDKVPKSFIEKLSFNVSLDGLEKIHNSLRGKNVFQKIISTLTILKRFRIDTTINFVINPFNSNQILNVYKLSSRLAFDFEAEVFSPQVPAYYHYTKGVDVGGNNKNWRLQAAKAIDGILAKRKNNLNEKQLSVLSDYLKTNNLKKDIISNCQTPSKLLFIRATGELYSCPYEGALGNIDDFTCQDFLIKQGGLARKIKNKGCFGCLSTMGALNYVR